MIRLIVVARAEAVIVPGVPIPACAQVSVHIFFWGRLGRSTCFFVDRCALASLNHPNIAAIHGIEEAEGTRALVLELVEGPTLADCIASG